MKTVIQIVLAILIVLLTWYFIHEMNVPIKFQKDKVEREAPIIERLKDIRRAEQAYRQINQSYVGDFDSLIHFVLTDSLPFIKTTGSKDDSLAVARGLVKEEIFFVPVIDTIFAPRKLTPDQVRDFPNVPGGQEGAKFILQAGTFETESGVIVPVFEARTPYKAYLSDMDHQELRNLIDDAEKLGRYPGLKVGDMNRATNDEGNWE